MVLLLPWLPFLVACTGAPGPSSADDSAAPVDADADGHIGVASGGEDCDDGDASVHPDATETCDGRDEDCDGEVDEGAADAGTWYTDADGDGYGDEAATIDACFLPDGYVADATDCDDTDAAVRPGAVEVCDGVDADCDGAADDGAIDPSTWYIDADGDGFGDDGSPVDACDAPDGTAPFGGDCDDTLATVSPVGVEVCDEVDQDCDGEADEAEAVDAGTWYADADGDGFGEGETSTVACAVPVGFVADATDCDDASAEVHPGAVERCDGADEDCDAVIDEDALDVGAFYADADADGFGDAGAPAEACDIPAGYVTDATDCDDADPGINPAAPERCDGLDQDCDTTVDEDVIDPGTWYADADGDGWGDPGVTTTACEPPAGHVADATDCDDTSVAVNPGATEVCDLVDDDCDTAIDEDAADAPTWYTDADADGFGDATSGAVSCEGPADTVADATDCDDADPDVYPGAPEVCDGRANDCDDAGWGAADEAGSAALVSADGLLVEDLTTNLAAGTASSPATYTLPAEGTVNLCAGTWYVAFAGEGSAAAIVGVSGAAETVLDGGGSGSLVALQDGEATLRGLTFTGAGGAVTLTGVADTPTLEVESCVFTGNTASYGSALLADVQASVTLTDTEVYGNTGAAIAANAGSAIVLVDSDVYENTDAAGFGAGVYLYESSTLVCTGTGGTHGLWSNADYAVVMGVDGGITSTGCYWGVGSDDNTPADVHLPEMLPDTVEWPSTYSFEAESFTCNSTTGCG